MIDKLRQIWPLALSGIVGFLVAAILFLPQVYSSNQNIYRVIRERINVLNQIIGYVNHFYFDVSDIFYLKKTGRFHSNKNKMIMYNITFEPI